ncbi:MAG: hypothetical protein ACXADL_09835 [Candidatus Thorarchaeota archaeon]|jgi:hypothetical protein
MPWDIENYYINEERVLCVEITIPLMEFFYTKIDDVKEAWLEMLGQFVSHEPGIDMSWVMEPKDQDALVTIKIAKTGELKGFSNAEAKGALHAVDALYDMK